MCLLWKLQTKDATPTKGGHKTNATAMAWSTKHPELFCSASPGDLTLVFWDARSECVRTVAPCSVANIMNIESGPTHETKTAAPVVQMKYTPDGDNLVLLDRGSNISRLQMKKLPTEEQTWRAVEPRLESKTQARHSILQRLRTKNRISRLSTSRSVTLGTYSSLLAVTERSAAWSTLP